MTATWQAERDKLEAARQIKEDLDRARIELETAKRTGDFASAGRLQYGDIPELERKLAEAEAREAEKLVADAVRPEQIAEVVERWTGIPTSKMLEGEREKLLRMEDALRKRVVGQDSALRAVANAVRRARAGLNDENRPLGSFLFLWADRRGQDRTDQGGRGLSVRRRSGHGAHRHVRIHGEAFGRAADWCSSGLCRV